ncbi:MAG: hypothetical protein NDJ94_18475 [Vicinamibacteria bacterium]|nr:hypothetical protein [Vicinamibacteria bacterium]
MPQSEIVGVVSALVYGGALEFAPRRWRLTLASVGLVVAALMYVGFALAEGYGQVLHIVGGAPFVVAAVLARRRPFLLGGAWIAHAIWDGVAMSHGGLFPAWYPFWCGSLDVVFGLYLMVRASAWQDPR